jgi:hypothetical protein
VADIVYGINRSETKDDVTVGAVDPGTHMYIVIDDAVGLRKEEILRHMDILKHKILEQPDHN